MTVAIEKFRVVVEIDGDRYAIFRELKFDAPSFARLTDRGPDGVVAEEHARRLRFIANAFELAAASVVAR